MKIGGYCDAVRFGSIVLSILMIKLERNEIVWMVAEEEP
jgi:hypothetical protein